jgi:hypothetical protein
LFDCNIFFYMLVSNECEKYDLQSRPQSLQSSQKIHAAFWRQIFHILTNSCNISIVSLFPLSPRWDFNLHNVLNIMKLLFSVMPQSTTSVTMLCGWCTSATYISVTSFWSRLAYCSGILYIKFIQLPCSFGLFSHNKSYLCFQGTNIHPFTCLECRLGGHLGLLVVTCM